MFSRRLIPAALASQPSFLIYALGILCWLFLNDSLRSANEDPLLVAPTEPLSAEAQQKMFHLPPGFAIQLVASDPEIRKPMNLAWDDRGRLWATQSIEYPWPAKEGASPRDTVRIFDSIGPDGRANKVSVFADGLNIPIGLLPQRDGALVYSIPNIEKHWDKNADGVSDAHEILFKEFGFRDTHGMASSFSRWIDGWVYGCHGFSNDSSVQGADGKAIQMNSGNTYRFKENGSTIEYFTHGQVNPFGLTFDEWGNVYSADCHTLPIYMLLRGAWYPSFGKPHDGLGYGPTMLDHLHGSTGIAGVVYYEADHFPPPYRRTMFVGNPVTGKINHDKLETNGSAFRAIEQPDFLTCDDPWFRPVDIKLGPDGALYIADFYNCIIGHYEVPLTHPRRDRERGRIWRVVFEGNDGQAGRYLPHNVRAAALDSLIQDLANPNLVVRTRATNEIVERGKSPETRQKLLDILRGKGAGETICHALWAYERLYGVDVNDLVRGITGNSPVVAAHCIRILAERPDWTNNQVVLATVLLSLDHPNAVVKRLAADALSRKGGLQPELVMNGLLKALKKAPPEDTHLVHTLRMALRDQMYHAGSLAEAEKIANANTLDAALLVDVALGAADPHTAEWLSSMAASQKISPTRFVDVARFIIRNLNKQIGQDDLGKHVDVLKENAKAAKDLAVELAALKAIREALLERGAADSPVFNAWADEAIQAGIASSNTEAALAAVELAGSAHRRFAWLSLTRLVASGAEPRLRQAALRSMQELDPENSIALLEATAANGAEPIELRAAAAELLANSPAAGAADAAVRLLALAPRRIAVTLASGLGRVANTAAPLLDMVAAGKVSADLLDEPVVKDRLLACGLPDIDKRMAELASLAPPRDERLSGLIADRLLAVEKAKAALTSETSLATLAAGHFTKRCGICHRLGGQGIKVGPELDGVGNRGPERLLEDILDPNRNVDQSFRASVITTEEGQTLSGLIQREEGEALVLVDQEGKEHLVPLRSITERRQTSLSPMPANLADTVTAEELGQIVAYLLSKRTAP